MPRGTAACNCSDLGNPTPLLPPSLPPRHQVRPVPAGNNQPPPLPPKSGGRAGLPPPVPPKHQQHQDVRPNSCPIHDQQAQLVAPTGGSFKQSPTANGHLPNSTSLNFSKQTVSPPCSKTGTPPVTKAPATERLPTRRRHSNSKSRSQREKSPQTVTVTALTPQNDTCFVKQPQSLAYHQSAYRPDQLSIPPATDVLPRKVLNPATVAPACTLCAASRRSPPKSLGRSHGSHASPKFPEPTRSSRDCTCDIVVTKATGHAEPCTCLLSSNSYRTSKPLPPTPPETDGGKAERKGIASACANSGVAPTNNPEDQVISKSSSSKLSKLSLSLSKFFHLPRHKKTAQPTGGGIVQLPSSPPSTHEQQPSQPRRSKSYHHFSSHRSSPGAGIGGQGQGVFASPPPLPPPRQRPPPPPPTIAHHPRAISPVHLWTNRTTASARSGMGLPAVPAPPVVMRNRVGGNLCCSPNPGCQSPPVTLAHAAPSALVTTAPISCCMSCNTCCCSPPPPTHCCCSEEEERRLLPRHRCSSCNAGRHKSLSATDEEDNNQPCRYTSQQQPAAGQQSQRCHGYHHRHHHCHHHHHHYCHHHHHCCDTGSPHRVTPPPLGNPSPQPGTSTSATAGPNEMACYHATPSASCCQRRHRRRNSHCCHAGNNNGTRPRSHHRAHSTGRVQQQQQQAGASTGACSGSPAGYIDYGSTTTSLTPSGESFTDLALARVGDPGGLCSTPSSNGNSMSLEGMMMAASVRQHSLRLQQQLSTSNSGMRSPTSHVSGQGFFDRCSPSTSGARRVSPMAASGAPSPGPGHHYHHYHHRSLVVASSGTGTAVVSAVGTGGVGAASGATAVAGGVSSSGLVGSTRRTSAAEERRITFQQNMLALRKMGWYWGPLSFQDAEVLLAHRPDGTFLVRDSGHDTYILSLSFRVRGTTYHTRIEHSQGKFSFYSQPETHSAATMVEFIEKAVAHSTSGKFHYFLQTSVQGQPPVEVPLLYPLSRFQVVQSLQHLARFTILSHVRRDHISRLPLPPALLTYLSEKQYYAEYLGDFEQATRDSAPLTFVPSNATGDTQR